MEATTNEYQPEPLRGRTLALDVFRGITIAGMILVNNPGSWSAIYPPLAHAEWHGWTPTDFIFPFFLFIVGVSITLAFARRAGGGGSRKDLLWKIVRRTLVIFALGLVLAGFPHYDASGHLSIYDLSTIRIPGVLQRIAVCYFFASVISLYTSARTQTLVALALLVIYWLLLRFVPVPGFGAGDLSMQGNLAAHVDRALLAGHTWKPLYDPEGILSTIPAIATTLAGVLTGQWLRSERTPPDKVAGLFVAGAGLVVAGWAWHFWFPINKALWTSSYVLFTAGLALQLLGVCYWLVDIKNYRRWATPFRIFGTNALAVFFLSGIFERIMSLIKFTRAGGSQVSSKTLIYETLFASWAAPVNASLLYAVCYVLFWLALMTILYRKRIFIKV
ncbi:MAG TPA: heparan-alpha-glucosaminide N-acetyltransferase domain-containing protein [Pyrinomonadaceae bacterium]|nr:heparan-alpha-glucosaminide N-acetyltransferase domain-containing protein [Pyrinomonadaceae bacterium]